MNLNLACLLENLRHCENLILDKIHNDEMLTKRLCPKLNVWIANASKELFSPKEEHQLYAKGIIYRREFISDGTLLGKMEYKLIGLPYIKMFNYGENESVINHVNKMISSGANAAFLKKEDGTMIARTIIDGNVVFSTRGMLETFVYENDEDRFFKWTRKIAEEKYPLLLDPNFRKYETLIFELVGPENRIITSYDDWDLILTGSHDNKFFFYLCAEELNHIANIGNLKMVESYEISGYNIEDKIKSLNSLLENTDKEGTVIQFELYGHSNDEVDSILPEVVGRAKVKTETYRNLLKIHRGCNFKNVAEIIQKNDFVSWDQFEEYIKLSGSDNFPEELMDQYKEYWKQYALYLCYCLNLIIQIEGLGNKIIDFNSLKFSYDGPKLILDKKGRAKFAEIASKTSIPSGLFAYIDNKLNTGWIMKKFKTIEEVKEAMEKISND